MDKCVCKLCGETVAMGYDVNVKMWFHLIEEHHKEFKKQENKTIQQLLVDNFEKLK